MSFSHDVEVTPAEIRRAWQEMIDGANPFKRQTAPYFISSDFKAYRSETADPWIGATGAEINERLIHGYAVDASDHSIGGGSTEFVMPTMELDDEQGDLVISQAVGGEDMYRVQWTDHEAPRSITIRACISMAASTDAKVLSDYLTWLLKVIDAAQRGGLCPTVELWMGTIGGLTRHPRERLRVRIPLVAGGEMIDVTSWQAYLTPGAFRSLGFFGLALGADRAGRSLNAGMGAPTNSRWGMTFEDGVLDIECPASAHDFPEAQMDQMLADCGV